LRRIFALATTLAIALTGLTALPSWASAPVNGTYDCNTGLIQNSPSEPNLTVLSGVVSAGRSCTGSVVIPSGTLSIASETFRENTAVTSIAIPATISSIGDLALYGTTALTSITVEAGSASFVAESGVLFNSAKTSLIRYPAAKSGTSFTAPSTVLTLGDFSFTDAHSLTSISLPDSVTDLGVGSFARTGLTSFHIPTSVTTIREYAFQGSSLTSITIPQGVTAINGFAFYENYALQTVHFPTSLQTIGTSAFSMPYWNWSYGSLTSAELPNGLISIGTDAFRGTKITSLTIPGSVTSLGECAYCTVTELTSLTISPGNLTNLGSYTFSGAPKLVSVSLPDNITRIGDGVFRMPLEANLQSLLTTLRLPSNLTYIGGSAFEGLNALTSITIPAGVTFIGQQAFVGDTSLATVNFAGNSLPTIDYGAFALITPPPAVSIPLTSTGAGVGGGWSGLQVTRPNGTASCGGGGTFTVTNGVITGSTSTCSGAVEVPYGITEVGSSAFRTRAITSVSIPNTVTTIANQAFGQNSLTSVTIPASVTSLSSSAFEVNDNLATVVFDGTIPAGFTWSSMPNVQVSGKVACSTGGYFVIAQNTVTGRRDCTGSVDIPGGVTLIGGEAFDADPGYGGGVGRENPFGSTVGTNITSLTIPNTVTTIGWFAFRNTHISSLVIPDSVTSIGIYAFAGSTATSISIGNGLATISGAAFAGFNGLQNLTIGSGVTSIENEAFRGSSSLTSVTIPDTVESIGTYAFSDSGAPFTLNYCGNADLTGTGLPSTASNASSCRPAPPRNLVVTPGNGFVAFSFTAGVAGGSSITGYKYSLDGITYSNFSPALSGSSGTITSLTNGTNYRLSLKAVSAIGASAASAAQAFTPAASAYANAVVSGVSSPAVGASPVSAVTSSSTYTGSISWSGSPTTFGPGTSYTATITLSPRSGYTFSGVPANYFTVSGATSVSNNANSGVITAVFPATGDVPDAPTNVVATRTGSTTGTVDFVAPVSDGGSAITGYAVTAFGDNTVTVNVGPNVRQVTLTGLIATSQYGVSVTAINANGSSSEAWTNNNLAPGPYDASTGDGSIYCTTDGQTDGAGYVVAVSHAVEYGMDCQGALVIPSGVTLIDEESLYGEDGITSISIPNTVTSIGDYAMANMYGLTSLTIPDSVTSIGNGAFRRMNNLTSLTIGSGITEISYRAFDRATSLVSLGIPATVTTIDNLAFSGLSNLTTLTLPEGLVSIGDYAFSNAFSLLNLDLPAGLQSMGEGAFSGAESLTSLVLPEGITTIGTYAFGDLSSLTWVSIPSSVTSLGEYAFGNALSLTTVYFLGNAPSVGQDFIPFGDAASGAEAVVSQTATGFGVDPTWQGLTLRRVVTVEPPRSSPHQNNNQQQQQISPVAAPVKALPRFESRERQRVSTNGQSLTLSGQNLDDVKRILINGKEAKISKKSSGELVIEVPAGSAGFPEVVVTSAAGVVVMQGLFQVVAPYADKRTAKVTATKNGQLTSASLAALKKSYQSATPANIISCSATVASNASRKDVALARKTAKATCQAMVDFSSYINTVNVQVSKTGRAGSKLALAVTFDRTLTGN